MFETKTVMTTDVITVKRHAPIQEAIRTLVRNNITGLPVVNDDMTLVGILSEKDVLRLLYDYEDRPRRVEDYMTRDVVSFNVHDDLIEICTCLLKNQFRRVPITSEGKLVGIISRKDIITHIADYQGFFRDHPQKVRVTTAVV